MKYNNNTFPIGFIRCSRCNRPALWLFERTKYTPVDSDRIQLTTSFDLNNIQLWYNPEELGYYLCDSCECEIDEFNIDSTYMEFIPELLNTYGN